MATTNTRTVSLVVPAFNEVESATEIVEFYRDIRAAHPQMGFELLVVDDGSTDGTARAVLDASSDEDRTRVVVLSRNFGSHAAISAGLAAARGDAALTLSADRQEPLEAVGAMLAAWADGADLVWGLRSVRASKGSGNEFFAKAFSTVFHAISTVPTYPQEGPSQILVSRKLIDVLVAMPEQNRNVLAMAAWTGFDQRRIHFTQLPRPHGVSKWTMAKKVKLVGDSIVEFSARPVTWLLGTGAAAVGLGLLLLVLALVLAATGHAATGAAIAGLVVLVGGLQIAATGVVGEYVWRAGEDARRRPVFIVRETLER